jgi:hypothetical protein
MAVDVSIVSVSLMGLGFGSGGMFAPLVGGALLEVDRAFPVYASIAVFCFAGTAVLLLKVDESKTRGSGTKNAMH